jgi:hypothetical protein
MHLLPRCAVLPGDFGHRAAVKHFAHHTVSMLNPPLPLIWDFDFRLIRREEDHQVSGVNEDLEPWPM